MVGLAPLERVPMPSLGFMSEFQMSVPMLPLASNARSVPATLACNAFSEVGMTTHRTAEPCVFPFAEMDMMPPGMPDGPAIPSAGLAGLEMKLPSQEYRFSGSSSGQKNRMPMPAPSAVPDVGQ